MAGKGWQREFEGSPLGAPEAETRSAMTVWIYLAETSLQENDPEGVGFEYEVLE
ncbi:hypothetical protein [Bradyrhizobium sp. AZCC 2289]|uniref:hypothetical protein n=1 Tax=Bradyrhizobium sp. AZCC 2289 TaxID=3117026 RepID=UPI002FF38741